jgi:hypothetical protein
LPGPQIHHANSLHPQHLAIVLLVSALYKLARDILPVVANRSGPDFPWHPTSFNTTNSAATHELLTALVAFPKSKPHDTSIPPAMAAAMKALNAKIRSNKYTDYFCSTRTFYPDSQSQVQVFARG